ncbi:MAG: polysaccharide biosynthesis/export family protein [Verrucomicrobiae bacterium]
MKLELNFSIRQGLFTLLAGLTLILTGCASNGKKADVMAAPEFVTMAGEDKVPRLHIGDVVSVTFNGLPEPVEPLDKPIKEDGTITLPDVGRVKAVGKTIGELEDAIHDLYVPKVYLHLNVTVKTSSDRVYYIRGEVRAPGRLIYAGPITVSKAITSAGDFTDFANRSSVILTRSNGDRFKLNLNKILAGDQPDPPVYPGDQIEVGRRLF